MNALEEQLAGLRQTEPERFNSFRPRGEDPVWDLVVEVIRLPELPVTQTATGARVSTATVERARAGGLTGTTDRAVEARAKLTAYAVKHARKQLRSAGVIDKPRKVGPPVVLTRYLEHAKPQTAERPCARAGCPNPAQRRSAYCTDRCARAALQADYRQRSPLHERQHRQHGRRPSADRSRRDPKRSGVSRGRHIGDQNARVGHRGVFGSARRRVIALGAAAVVGLGLFAVLRAAHVFGHDRPIHDAGRSAQAAAPSGGGPQQAISSYLKSLGAARRAATRLHGIRAAELNAVITNVTSISARRLLTPSRLPVLSLTLDRNREWWSSGPLLAPHQQVEFPGSRLVWQYYPGQGIEFSPQASFAKAHVLCTAGPSHLRACTELMSELIALAVNRSGRLAWEYYFNFDGGLPPWTSALSQGTALQALADAYKATKNRLYLAEGNRALALFTAAPPSGVAVQTPLGARYVEYSFDPAPGDEVLNAFLKSVIGLYEYAQASKSPLATRLFAAGNAEAQADLPQFDTGSWSLYQPGVQASLPYHELVIRLLQQLCAMTRASVYCTTGRHFESYLKASPGG